MLRHRQAQYCCKKHALEHVSMELMPSGDTASRPPPTELNISNTTSSVLGHMILSVLSHRRSIGNHHLSDWLEHTESGHTIRELASTLRVPREQGVVHCSAAGRGLIAQPHPCDGCGGQMPAEPAQGACEQRSQLSVGGGDLPLGGSATQPAGVPGGPTKAVLPFCT